MGRLFFYEEQYEDYYFTYIARGTYKTCSKCEEVKLMNERYFKWDKTNKRFKSMCKECENQIQREYRKSNIYWDVKRVASNYKKCSKCKEMLPATEEYFYLELMGKDGFKSKCVNCS